VPSFHESNVKKEPWWTDARKVLVTQILTLLLTPASVAVTYYLTEAYKAPRPNIEYVSASPLYFAAIPSRALADRINSEARLAWGFREELRRISALQEGPKGCVAWLDGEDWDSDCANVYKGLLNQMKGMLQTAIDQLKRGQPANLSLPLFSETNQLADAERALTIVEDFSKELAELQSKSQSRSGDVKITVGILNRGASDGTILRGASLRFAGQQIKISASDYTAIKAHSFAEVSFTTPREDAGKIYGTWTVGEEAAVKKWSDMVKKGDEVQFELLVSVSDKKASIAGSVPKEE